MWRGVWPGRLALAFGAAQALLFCLLALWPWAGTPQAALQAAEARSEVWLRSGFALLALMALPLLLVLLTTLRGSAARGLVLFALAATVVANWQMTTEIARILPLRDTPLELARALLAARVEGAALALVALAAIIAARRADALR